MNHSSSDFLRKYILIIYFPQNRKQLFEAFLSIRLLFTQVFLFIALLLPTVH